ncbi:SGNH/GDSL hydrolase family protein [Raineya orbicola]|uniref:GDSL-like Lipase/Acylhydrolase family n=1 Tax=Raineya orbicola TaxID=2016530 RepID=A0A2N3IKD3_9BACT|nr:hypothetical protein [Raineya orbicola]PKQ70779.1 GDSL-like Lipase/Acylhydrolase family [Raineya orbicola]
MQSVHQTLRIFLYVAILVSLWKGFEFSRKFWGNNYSEKKETFSSDKVDIKAKNQWIDSLQNAYSYSPNVERKEMRKHHQENPNSAKSTLSDTSETKFTRNTFLAYPKNNLKTLQYFFSALQNLENGANEHYRILYFADSQIEGDRITATLRTALQEKVGGCGVGLQGFTNANNIKFSIQQENDEKLKNYFLLGKALPEKKQTYGILGQTYLYSEKDTASYTIFRKSEKASEKAQKVENIKILFRNTQTPTLIEIWESENKLSHKKFEPASQVHFWAVPLQTNFSEIKVTWQSANSPEMYAVALDCNKGITVDNIPIRGSAGLEFTKMNLSTLQAQAEYLNPCLVILHFGVNVTMNTTDFGFYERKMMEQINFLKKAFPKASFVLVGISDRSYKSGNAFETYPAVEILRRVQKRIALQADCAFWDLYEAMGGKNTMPLWVEKGLASKDYTHFTLKGAEIIGNMFFEALWSDFQSYKNIQ